MPVAKLTLELEIPHAQSLKDRRQVVRSMKDALRHNFNISIAETDGALVWNRATIEIVAVSASVRYLAGQLATVERAATRHANRFGALLTDTFAETLADDAGDDLELLSDPTAGYDSSLSDPDKL